MSGRNKDDGDEDQNALWHMATHDVKPLSGRARPTRAHVVHAPPAPQIATRPRAAKAAPVMATATPARDLDRRTRERLEGGKMVIDGTFDLHGHTQDEAHALLCRALTAAWQKGARCILVITGKGRGGAGILRARLPEWLDAAPLRAIVLRAVPARPNHGGGGAFYVLLRRQRNA